jgi:hypothetical protein
MMTKRIDGDDLPDGAHHAVILFFNDDGAAVDDSVATESIIELFDADDNIIGKVYGRLG